MVGRDGRLIPMVACIGNHEVDGGYGKPRAKAPFFYALFDGLYPETGYATLDFGDYLSLVLLDTGHTTPIGGEQTDWLEKTLKARADHPQRVRGQPRPGLPVVPQDGGQGRQGGHRRGQPQALGAAVREVPRAGRAGAPRPHLQADQAAARRPGRRQRRALPRRRLLGPAAHAADAGEAAVPGRRAAATTTCRCTASRIRSSTSAERASRQRRFDQSPHARDVRVPYRRDAVVRLEVFGVLQDARVCPSASSQTRTSRGKSIAALAAATRRASPRKSMRAKIVRPRRGQGLHPAQRLGNGVGASHIRDPLVRHGRRLPQLPPGAEESHVTGKRLVRVVRTACASADS